MQADWRRADPDGPAALALIRRMVAAKIGFDPTLTVQSVPPSQRSAFSLEEYAVAADAYRRMGRFVARAQHEGVLLLAGTDDGDLFAELEAYVDAGIPVLDALRAATVNGARWLSKDAEFGTIEPGKRADLLLVDGNPLADIHDLRKTALVVKAGRVVFRGDMGAARVVP
jgi:imidazolonepropionase-like amidohydrolase